MRDDHLADSFLISPGTQVILRRATALPNVADPLPTGAVGIVVESPPENARPYLVEFLGGVRVKLKFAELLVRRLSNLGDAHTAGPDVSAYTIYRVVVGSRAFGLATEASDEDHRGIFLPPADWHWGLVKPPEQVESFGHGVEVVLWEVEKFVRLALQANPNLLETLWSDTVISLDETGAELRAIRGAFLSRCLYSTYSGYVLSQFRLMAKKYEAESTYKPKHAMHLVRLLQSGIYAVRHGEIRVDVGEHRAELLAIRAGGVPFADVRSRALELDAEFRAAFAETTLPERPDFDRANRFLIAARRRRARECTT